MSFNLVCRLCANFTNEVDLIDVVANKNDLESKIEECFRLNLQNDNYLPKQVCIICSSKVHSYYEFYVQVQKAQIVFQSNPSPALVEIKVEVNDNIDDKFDVSNLSYSGGKKDPENGADADYEDIKSESMQITSCTQKSKTYRKNNELKQKVSDSAKKAPPFKLKCHLCNELYHKEKDLRSHFESIHEKPVEYICLECSKIFVNYFTFRSHIRNHINQFKFRCEICDKFFSSNRKLQNHRERHNKIRKKYFCSSCGKGFLNDKYLTIHEKRAHSTPINDETGEQKDRIIRNHECDQCHKMFASINSLNHHKKVHVGIREHTCEHCGKSFLHKSYLDYHVASHSSERPFKCEICSTSFKSKVYLRRHSILHTAVKSHQCHTCGKKFFRKAELMEHSITHTDLYPFKCKYCDKSFRAKKNVVTHELLHTGERPYSCDTCENRHFTCSSNYHSHMRRVHGIVRVKKEIAIVRRTENPEINDTK